jgi:hypothetical protein
MAKKYKYQVGDFVYERGPRAIYLLTHKKASQKDLRKGIIVGRHNPVAPVYVVKDSDTGKFGMFTENKITTTKEKVVGYVLVDVEGNTEVLYEKLEEWPEDKAMLEVWGVVE